MSKTKIEWADVTINPVIGCSPASDGCKNCYAKRMWPRQKGMGTRLYKDMEDFHDVKWDVDILRNALEKLKKPQRIFLCSMSDLFHNKVPNAVIKEILEVAASYPQHQFLILTKRYQRLASYLYYAPQVSNIHFGISICDSIDLDLASVVFDQYNFRRTFFVSFEPLLGYISRGDLMEFVNEFHVNWFIVGAETGPGHREFRQSWALDILKVARRREIPFFFKKRYLSDGKTTTDILNNCKFHEFPKEMKL